MTDQMSPAEPVAPSPWWRAPRAVAGGFAAAILVPFLVIALKLRNPKPYVVLDLAQTELRVRGVFSKHPPLIGLPGRLGDFGVHTGSHPGPLSFWILAPLYRLFGSDGWAMFAGALTVNFVWVCLALWLGWRRGGLPSLIGVGAVVMVLVHTFGPVVVEQPWNPYLPLMAWTVVLLAAWSVLDDDIAVLPVLVVAASYCMQTHIPYLGMGGGVVAGTVIATVIWRYVRRRAQASGSPEGARLAWLMGDAGTWPPLRTLWIRLGGSLVLGLLLWAPPIFDQLHSNEGNFTLIWRDMTDPPKAAGGLSQGVELILQHLNLPQLLTGHRIFFVMTNPVWPGIVLLAVWVCAVAVAWRLRQRRLVLLHALIAWSLILALVALSKIYGDLYWYLTMWMWTISAGVVASIVWTVIAAVTHLSIEPNLRRRLGVASSAVLGLGLVVLFVATTGRATGATIPDRNLSNQVAHVVPPTVAAVKAGRVPGDTGKGMYLVTWFDPVKIGDAGYALLDELNAHGISAGLRPTFLGIVPGWQTVPEFTERGVIHLSVGDADIKRWRANPKAYEAVYYDGRTPAEKAEYARLRSDAARLIAAAGGDPKVVDNPTKASLDTSLPLAATQNMSKMSDIGLPMAVFLAPPGS